MRLRQAFLILSLIGIIAPILLIWNAMNGVDWNFQQASDDFQSFVVSVFGRVVLIGYFISGLSLTMFVIYEAHARSDYYLYWAIIMLIIFGIGAALPFYLFLRMPKRE